MTVGTRMRAGTALSAAALAFAGFARGGHEVDCAWKDGRPVRVAVRGPEGRRPSVRFAGKEVDFVREATVRQGLDCPETRRGRVPGRECEKGRKD